MRRRLVMVSAGMAAALVLAGGCTRPAERAHAYRVVCTTYPVWLFTRAVVGSTADVDVQLLIPADAGCPHEFTMQPSDVRRLASADVLVINSLGLDAFAEDRFRAMRMGAPVITATAGISDLLPSGEVHEHGTPHAPSAPANPHLFASPYQAARMVRTIAEALAKLRPGSAAQYRANADHWAARLNECGNALKLTVASLRNRSIITQHDVFDYLARDTGLHIVGVVTGRPGEDPAAAEVLDLVKRARALRAGAVFTEPQYPERMGAMVARQVGIPHATLDPVATGPPDAGPDYYLSVMKRNMETLSRVLGTRQ